MQHVDLLAVLSCRSVYLKITCLTLYFCKLFCNVLQAGYWQNRFELQIYLAYYLSVPSYERNEEEAINIYCIPSFQSNFACSQSAR